LDKILRNFANVKAEKISLSRKCIFRIVNCNSQKQGCGPGTQISG